MGLYFENIEQCLNSKIWKSLVIKEKHKIKIKKIIKKFSKKFIYDNFLTFKGFIKYDVCGDWEKRINKIREKNKNDSSSLEIHILRYGSKFGKKIWQEKTKKTTVNKEFYIHKYGLGNGERLYKKLNKKKRSVGKKIMIKKYGEEIGNNKWNEYLKKWKKSLNDNKGSKKRKSGLTLEEFQKKHGKKIGFELWEKRCNHIKYINSEKFYIEKYGNENGKKKWKKYCEKRDYSSLSYYIKKFGEEDGKNKYEEMCKQKSYENSKEYYIKKYGKINGIENYNKCIEKRTEYLTKSRKTYSKISQELFWEIYKSIDESLKECCLFAELNQEYIFYVHSDEIKVFFVDFKLKNIVIEFNGNYWHSFDDIKKLDISKKNFLKNF